MSKQVSCFFAYAASPADIAESLELAISHINIEGMNLVNVTGWKSIGVVGRMVVDEVCQFIDKSDIFICDLTVFDKIKARR